jgi:tRNA pseudouridine38-40 synthase
MPVWRGTVRVALGVEYDGTHFHGWQAQEGTRTVQSCLEQALYRVADHRVQVVGAGRTDAGVHATVQVVHFDTRSYRSPRSWVLGANANLPRDLSVLWAVPVPEDFHARFSAIGRTYRYVILNRWTRPALLAHRACWECRPLEVDRMREAAAYLLGEHDFSSFRALACQAKSPVRTVRRLTIERQGERIYIEVTANAFLHHMVRNIAGVLIAIGLGKHPPVWAQKVLEARDRTLGGATASAQGLYLVGVEYPAHFSIPNPPLSNPARDLLGQ